MDWTAEDIAELRKTYGCDPLGLKSPRQSSRGATTYDKQKAARAAMVDRGELSATLADSLNAGLKPKPTKPPKVPPVPVILLSE